MENVWHLFNNTSGGRGQSSHSTTNPHHHAWELGNSTQPYNFPNGSTNNTHYFQEGALMFPPNHHELPSSSSSDGSNYYHMDPHLTCLKLGKRHYFENSNNNNIINNNNNNSNDLEAINRVQEPGVIKKVKNIIDGQEPISGGGLGGCGGLIWQPPSPPATPTMAPTMAPMCQVEGCSVMLVNAKDYHKRHKVCEMHSKAPKVIVLGIEQRFCQQCSRFHAVSEFDESKRSCRRRLAGHNERRRKSSQEQPVQRSLVSSDKVMASGGGGGCGYLPLLSAGGALSLMSSNNNQFNFSPDLSAQSSAALRELMVENRAHSWRNHHMEDQNVLQNHRVNYFPVTDTVCWEDLNVGAHLSLERRL